MLKSKSSESVCSLTDIPREPVAKETIIKAFKRLFDKIPALLLLELGRGTYKHQT